MQLREYTNRLDEWNRQVKMANTKEYSDHNTTKSNNHYAAVLWSSVAMSVAVSITTSRLIHQYDLPEWYHFNSFIIGIYVMKVSLSRCVKYLTGYVGKNDDSSHVCLAFIITIICSYMMLSMIEFVVIHVCYEYVSDYFGNDHIDKYPSKCLNRNCDEYFYDYHWYGNTYRVSTLATLGVAQCTFSHVWKLFSVYFKHVPYCIGISVGFTGIVGVAFVCYTSSLSYVVVHTTGTCIISFALY